MARLKKSNGYYRKRFRLEKGGKVYCVYGKTPDELRENENKKRLELEKGLQETINPTLDQYIKHHLQECEKVSRTATINAKIHAFNIISSVSLSGSLKLGDMKLKDITRRNITDAREILLHENKTPEYLNICFRHLNHLFNCAVAEDLIIKNPITKLSGLKRENETINETKHRALTEKETKLFFEYANKKNSIYLNCFLFMIKTGVRVGELSALNIKDIDLKANKIYIRRTITKDLNGAYIMGSDTKTKKSNRYIPLTPELLDIIKAQEKQNALLFNETNLADARLFKTNRGCILTAGILNREIKAICKNAGIDAFSSHAFRNTFATYYIQQRPQDFKILSEILGHKDIAITLNLYTHTLEEQKTNSMQAIHIKTS